MVGSGRQLRLGSSAVFRRFDALASESAGQSLVEFAFVAPLLMLAVTGILWMGIALNQYQVLTNAVGDGARAFALSRSTSQTDPCNYTVGIIEAAAPNLTAGSLTFSMKYTPSGGTATTYSTTCSGLSMNAGDTVQITSTYPVTTNVFAWGVKNLTLTAQTTELVE